LDQDSRTVDATDGDDNALAALIGKAGEGDTSALGALYDRTGSLLFGLVLRMVPERTAAEELLLDIYARIWKESAGYDPERFKPLEWLITIARTRAICRLDATREGKKRTVTVSGEPEAPPTVAPPLQGQARAALQSLAPPQREALEWAFYTGLSCNEIAAQSGKPPGAIRTYTRIGMSKLYDLFRPLYERGTGSGTAGGGL